MCLIKQHMYNKSLNDRRIERDGNERGDVMRGGILALFPNANTVVDRSHILREKRSESYLR